MAHVVRKVNRKAVAGQKKQSLNKKKRIVTIISSVFLGILVIGAIVLLIGIPCGWYDDTAAAEEKVEYFDKYTTTKKEGEEQQEVEFNSATYYQVLNYASQEYVNPNDSSSLFIDNIFVFAYDSDSFAADLENENDINNILLHRLADFQLFINSLEDEKIQFFVIDTAVGTGYNLYTNELFGFSEDSSQPFALFAYIKDGKLEKTIDLADKDEQSVYATSAALITYTAIPNATQYIKTSN